MTDYALAPADLDALAADFGADPRARFAQNAVTTTDVRQIALDRRVVTSIDTSMSDKLDTWGVTNQKKSGRCWLFSGLNFLRSHVIDTLKVENFEFSQAYLHFWDKLEKANWFFTAMIELADRDIDDRTIHRLLSDPIGDGGQWDMFVSLVLKYGLVPKYAMPETDSSEATAPMNIIPSTPRFRLPDFDVIILPSVPRSNGVPAKTAAFMESHSLPPMSLGQLVSSSPFTSQSSGSVYRWALVEGAEGVPISCVGPFF